MESPPSLTENDSDTKESGKKQKKRAEVIGAIAVEPKPAATSAAERPRGILSRLADSEAKPDKDPKAETKASREAEPVLDELSEAEKRYVEREIVQAQHSGAAGERPSGTETDSDQISAEAAVERFHEKILNDDMDSDQAFSETLEELTNEDAENNDSDDDEIAAAEAVQAPREFGEDVIAIDRPEVTEVDETVAAAAAGGSGSGGGPIPPPPPIGSASGGSGTGSPPPRPPGGPYGGGYTPMPGYNPAAAPGVPLHPNLATSPLQESEPNRATVIGDAVLGGIIGYLVGRRHGRIKTEKRLLPIQKKLEKQVGALRQDILNKETVIRQTAREKSGVSPRLVPEIARPIAELRRPAAIEATEVHGKLPLERIGHVLVNAEARQAPAVPKPRVEKIESQDMDKQALTMSRNELLLLSEKIAVEGSSLRQIYDTHLVSERGLRRIISEYLRGGDVHRVIRRELVEHEIDFERDPLLRDRTHPYAAAVSGTTDGQALDDLLHKVNADATADSRQEAAVMKAREVYQASERQHQKRQRRILDVSLAGTIAVLLAVIIFLVMSHG